MDYGWAPLHGLRRVDDKYILAPTPEYYDLRADPDEERNLHDEADAAGELSARLLRRLGGSLEATSARDLFPRLASALPGLAGADLASVGSCGLALEAAEVGV